MVGRSPEFLGKKIEAFEVKMAIIAILSPNLVILVFTAIAYSYRSRLDRSQQIQDLTVFLKLLYAFAQLPGIMEVLWRA